MIIGLTNYNKLMKICVIVDHRVANKTILGVVKRWEADGHDVHVDMYYDNEKVEWADVVMCDYIQGGTCDLFHDMDNITTPVHVRGIDIDLYYAHFMGLDLNRFTSLMFINDYMRQYAVDKYESANHKITIPIHTVPVGIETKDWKYNDKSSEHGKKIGWINNFWSGKGVGILCQVIYNILKEDREYTFEVVGNCSEPWLEKYFEEFIKSNDFQDRVKRINNVVSVNDWLDKMDYILSTSMKECQSLPMLEAMAKGIKPLIHNWWGADKLYPDKLVWNGVNEIMPMLQGEYNSREYRDFVIEHNTIKKEYNLLNEILGICKK